MAYQYSGLTLGPMLRSTLRSTHLLTATGETCSRTGICKIVSKTSDMYPNTGEKAQIGDRRLATLYHTQLRGRNIQRLAVVDKVHVDEQSTWERLRINARGSHQGHHS